MIAPWAGAEPEALPPLAPIEWVRLGLRAAAALVLTLALFAVFLVCRGIDLFLKALWRAHLPALAPWVVHLWGRLALSLTGLSFRRIGTPMTAPGAIVANHASWIDIVVLMRASRLSFVSKAEVGGWPGIGAIGHAIGTVFISRRPGEARQQRDQLLVRLRRGDRLALFPEGTSTDGRRVLPFKSTLFDVFFAPELRDVVSVQPVTIVYEAPPGLPGAFYGWWGDMDFAASAREVLARSRGGRVTLVFHEPLRVADFTGRKPLAERAEALVREGLERVDG